VVFLYFLLKLLVAEKLSGAARCTDLMMAKHYHKQTCHLTISRDFFIDIAIWNVPEGVEAFVVRFYDAVHKYVPIFWNGILVINSSNLWHNCWHFNKVKLLPTSLAQQNNFMDRS